MTSSTPSPEREESGRRGDNAEPTLGSPPPVPYRFRSTSRPQIETGMDEHDFHDPHAGECHDPNHLLVEGQLGSLLEEIEKLDARMLRSPDTATTEDGTITSYRIPVGPWHRIIGIARGGPRQGR